MPGDHVKLNIANMLLLRYHALSKQCRLGQYFEMSIVLNYYHVHRAFTTQRFNIFQRETKQVSKKILLYNCVLSSIKLLQILLSTPITYTYQVWFFCVFFFGGGYIFDILIYQIDMSTKSYLCPSLYKILHN